MVNLNGDCEPLQLQTPFWDCVWACFLGVCLHLRIEGITGALGNIRDPHFDGITPPSWLQRIHGLQSKGVAVGVVFVLQALSHQRLMPPVLRRTAWSLWQYVKMRLKQLANREMEKQSHLIIYIYIIYNIYIYIYIIHMVMSHLVISCYI